MFKTQCLKHPQVISILMVETTLSRGMFMAGFPTQTHLFGLRCRAGSSQKATDATLGYRQNASFDDTNQCHVSDGRMAAKCSSIFLGEGSYPVKRHLWC